MTIGRLAAIGDVHGNAALLARAIAVGQRALPDAIVCLGDIVGDPAQTERCCELLKSNQVSAVRGNHDRWLLEAIQERPELRDSVNADTLTFLAALPPIASFETQAGVALACHGVGANDLGHFPVTFLEPFLNRLRRLGRLPQDCRVILHGHTHETAIHTSGDVLIASIGPLHEHGTTGCAIIDFDPVEVTWLPY